MPAVEDSVELSGLKPAARTDAHEIFEFVLRAHKGARRDRYELVVPAISRQVWRADPAIGTVRDVIAMGERRVLLDIETTHSLAELNGVELMRASQPLHSLGTDVRSAWPSGHSNMDHWSRMWTFDSSAQRSAVRLGFVDSSVVFVPTVESQRDSRSLQAGVATSERANSRGLPVWTIGTIVGVPVVLAALILLAAIGALPWPLALAIGAMLTSLLATALLQFRWIYRRPDARLAGSHYR